MTATRDSILDIIERPARPRGLLDTPHGDGIADRLTAVSVASMALLEMCCVIECITVTDSSATIRLHRAPPAGAFGSRNYRVDATQAPAIASTPWHDLTIEWPAPAGQAVSS